ncbi:MAG: bifunctional UDP-N-acetylmuramoyl-tripeptide:D-alanyl-D-alanine ligase/alanine racemase [Bacteroidota bacterium]|nr:bifunctional UDP-N-acetylmuramoyl-tripeptide:D-alanyl-D-alanine ligase/alanine racemase [Bacteroidota bacterium]
MNNAGYSVKEVISIIKGSLIKAIPEEVVIKHIGLDSRKLYNVENSLFFCIIGKHHDGHIYFNDLYEKGIRNFVVSVVPEGIEKYEANIIVVKNTLTALQALAAYHRRRFDIPVIGITGSNGKTIVKEWLYQLLSEDKNVVRSPKSYNSQVGVPLSVWQMDDSHEIGIFEAGISESDEMDKLQSVIQPTIGIFTNIGTAHDENFIHQNHKIGEKLKLFTKVETLIYCSDYHSIKERIIRSEIFNNKNLLSWSKSTNADLLITSINKQNQKTEIKGIYKNNELDIKIPFIDDASIENAIHCWLTMLWMEYDNDTIKNRIKNLSSIAMRLELKEGVNNCSVINDSYSSDLDSLTIALDFMNQQKQHKKKTIILSDILQSGKSDIDLYSEVSEMLKEKGINRIIGIGKSLSFQKDRFDIEKSFYNSTDDFIKEFNPYMFSNETILLKGARIFEFEKISNIIQQKAHETVLEINLNGIIHNLNYYRSLIKPGTKLMAMVKAFSYGSGSFEIANLLQFYRVDYLTVAYADEGIELRKAGITMPIMVMNTEESSIDNMITYNLEPEIYSFRVLGFLENALSKNKTTDKFPIHLKIDTGMHRLGFEKEDTDELILRIKANEKIQVSSVFTHLVATDDPVLDDFTMSQLTLFTEITEKIKSSFDYPILVHALNSAGIVRFRDFQFDMVRLGIGLYGISFNAKEQENLINVSTLKTVISQIKNVPLNESIGYNRKWIARKNMQIATIAIGYADGLSRRLSNGVGKVMVNGVLANIVGNICMDMCMIDVTNIPVKEGDEVIVFGNYYPIAELARQSGTIPYEILTNISRRVKRIYYQE